MQKRIYRSRTNRMIAGVCGGLGEYFNIDPTLIRVLAVLTIFFGGFGILAYIILAIVVPLENSANVSPRDSVKENIEDIKDTVHKMRDDIRSYFPPKNV